MPEAAIALYHSVRSHEDFEHAARALLDLVRKAATEFPGKPRHLYLDIDEHRNDADGFDHDMFELQSNFLLTFLMPLLTEATVPLGKYRNENQSEDVPDGLHITQE